MKRLSRPILGLRAKLILSYLGVALAAILVLTAVITIVVQNYFYTTENDLLHTRAESTEAQVVQAYQEANGVWDNIVELRLYTPDLVVVVDTTGRVRGSSPFSYSRLSQADIPVLRQSLQQALAGREVDGVLQGGAGDSDTFSGQYVTLPLRDNGHIIGAMLLAEPRLYPQGFSPNEFLVKVDLAILIAAIGVALAVFLFSLPLAHGLTRPLTDLTRAAEQMKGGNYTQRVAPPETKDELGRLALTFNAMADTIESDVTELRRQEQVRRDLIANIAHDLITPLTAIQGLSEALADEVISEPKARHETAQLIGREVQRLRRLVGDMQHMSSLESGHLQLDLAPLDLHGLVDEMLAVIGPECEQAGISIQNNIAPTTPMVLADSDRITQVLLNLLDNARRHTPSGGSICINARTQGKDIAVEVADTGTGIDPADLPHIFERFYRADRSRTGATGGTGLGLSIVKAIVTSHGGSIHAESTPGKCTRIIFTLPVASQ